MRRLALFVTGTDTGVGKTVVAAWLTRWMVKRGIEVAPLKPLCSGGRADAESLRDACHGALSLDDINPWHFSAPLAPVLAARREGRRVNLAQVVEHLQRVRRRFAVTIIEGAGGLLSPMGEDFNSRDLIAQLRALPVIVCPNRLGAVGQSLLALEALPRAARRKAVVVLVSLPRRDQARLANPGLLAEQIGPGRICLMPWLGHPPVWKEADGAARALWQILARSSPGSILTAPAE